MLNGAKLKINIREEQILIPNLVETVKGVAEFEKETFKAITEARSKVNQIKIKRLKC